MLGQVFFPSVLPLGINIFIQKGALSAKKHHFTWTTYCALSGIFLSAFIQSIKTIQLSDVLHKNIFFISFNFAHFSSSIPVKGNRRKPQDHVIPTENCIWMKEVFAFPSRMVV